MVNIIKKYSFEYDMELDLGHGSKVMTHAKIIYISPVVFHILLPCLENCDPAIKQKCVNVTF